MTIPSNLPPQLQLNTIKGQGLNLSAGQVITGKLLNIGQSTALLQIGNLKVTASLTGQPLNATLLNQPIQLLVTQTTPTLGLKLQSETNPSPDQQLKVIQTALKQVLPNHVPLSQGIAQLTQLLQTANLPIALQGALNALFESLFRPRTSMSGADIKSAFLNSGVFLERSLLQYKEPNKHDFKSSLLKLLALAEAAEPQSKSTVLQLEKVLTQMLNKLTLQQLQMIEHPHSTHIELPLAPNIPAPNFTIEIRKQNSDQPDSWEFIITLNLPDGELVTKATYSEETFSFNFWAESPLLKEKLEQKLPQFEKQLKNSGLRFNTVLITPNRPIESATSTKVALIDIHI